MNQPTNPATLAIRIWSIAILLAALQGLAVRMSGTTLDARRWLAFSFDGVPNTPTQTLQIFLHNTALAAAPLLAAALPPRSPLVRKATEGLLITVFALNTGLIGLAAGAYGTQLIAALAPHALLELAGFATAGATYITRARSNAPVRLVATGAFASALLLATAAIAETYLGPQA